MARKTNNSPVPSAPKAQGSTTIRPPSPGGGGVFSPDPLKYKRVLYVATTGQTAARTCIEVANRLRSRGVRCDVVNSTIIIPTHGEIAFRGLLERQIGKWDKIIDQQSRRPRFIGSMYMPDQS